MITFEDADGVEHTLPSKFEVCPTCEGRGSHSLRFGAISMEDFQEWDEEEREDYINGAYDKTCETCGGQRVVSVVDPKLCDRKLLKRYRAYRREIAETDAIHAAERRAELWAAGER